MILDVDLAVREWRENAAKPTKARGVVVSLASAQKDLAAERTRQLRQLNDIRDWKFLDRNTVVREQFECARIVREALHNVPARIAAAIAAESDPQRVHALLDAELRAALENAADALIKLG